MKPEGQLQSYSDPESELSCQMLGGTRFESINVTRSQMKSLQKLYGTHDETDNEVEGVNELMTTAMRVNVLKKAKHDGARLMAIIAKYCHPGEDPARFTSGTAHLDPGRLARTRGHL